MNEQAENTVQTRLLERGEKDLGVGDHFDLKVQTRPLPHTLAGSTVLFSMSIKTKRQGGVVRASERASAGVDRPFHPIPPRGVYPGLEPPPARRASGGPSTVTRLCLVFHRLNPPVSIERAFLDLRK